MDVGSRAELATHEASNNASGSCADLQSRPSTNLPCTCTSQTHVEHARRHSAQCGIHAPRELVGGIHDGGTGSVALLPKFH